MSLIGDRDTLLLMVIYCHPQGRTATTEAILDDLHCINKDALLS